MTEGLWIAVISSAAALIGSIIGFIASSIQAARNFARQMKLEEIKREWNVADQERDHEISVIGRRCDQAEQFVLAMAEDFNQFRTQSRYLIKTPVENLDEGEVFRFAHWQEYIDKKVLGYGPIVSALSDPAHDLVAQWKRMEEVWADMAMLYSYVYQKKVVEGVEIDKPSEINEDILAFYSRFNQSLSNFYSAIDDVRRMAFANVD